MLHVGMNIQDKAELFREIYRVLQPGGFFGIYDIMRISEGDLTYPVPWASESATSHLSTPDQYIATLQEAGFRVTTPMVRREFAVAFFREARQKRAALKRQPAMGLHVLMQDTTSTKISNMVQNIEAGLIAPAELIAYK